MPLRNNSHDRVVVVVAAVKLVSAIMPTRGRPQWAAQALECFMAQTYAATQLVILDDEAERSFPKGFEFPDNVIYRAVSIPAPTIAAKRNACCEMATGEIIAHWDSDDWSAPERIADQVKLMEESGKAVTGFHSMLFYSADPLRIARYRGSDKQAMGTSLMYRRDWWQAHRFPPSKNIGEDGDFVKLAVRQDRMISVDAGQMQVARVHHGNTSEKKLHLSPFVPASLGELPEGFPR